MTDPPSYLLDAHALFELDPAAGTVRFAGERSILLGAAALGDLRRHVLATFGAEAACTMLVRLGFAHGWRMAGAVQRERTAAGLERWRDLGGYVHMLQGHMRLDERSGSPLSAEGCSLTNSFEAEQHLDHFEESTQPVCWMLCGVASGYISRIEGEQILVIEEQCMANGHSCCRFRGKRASAWGPELDHVRSFFQIEDLGFGKTSSTPSRSPSTSPGDQPAAAQARTKIVAESDAMRDLLYRARLAARAEISILISGESGVGKERIARFIHDASQRAGGPFVAVNCAAIPDSLAESELFGHRRGAFTGALVDRPGLFEMAQGGTLFLDEIGEMSSAIQAKVLRVLQERVLRRVGDGRERTVDVRVVSASKRSLQAEMRAQRFREDLYYRLNGLELVVAPLRERREDILPLARLALRDWCERRGARQLTLSGSAQRALLRHSWHGNVRELRNAVERAAVFARGTEVTESDLYLDGRLASPEALRESPNAAVKTLDVIEREHILAVLAQNGGNQVRTALQLGIAESTLYRKLKGYGGIITPREMSARPPDGPPR